jgi:C4-dicarboxylate transporter DctM subunit
MLISCLCIFYGIITRAFNNPAPWVYEVTIYMMMWFVVLALSFTQQQKANIEMDIFITRISEKKREVLNVAIYLFSLTFAVIFAFYAFKMFLSSLVTEEIGFYYLTVQLWWVKLSFFVGTLLLALQIIRMLVGQCRILYVRSKENAKELRNNLLLMLPIFAVLLAVSLYLIVISPAIGITPIIGLLILLFVLLFFGVPIGFTLGLVGSAGLFILFDGQRSLAAITIQAYSNLNSFIFIALPLYIFAGQLMQSGKLAEQFFKVGSTFLGHLPGGLGVATIFACAIFAAINGSSAATAATIGLIAIPQLMKYGYSKGLACGMVAAGGTLGILIPPSNSMILIGAITGESVGKLFMAGLIPGIILAILFAVTSAIVAKAEHAQLLPKATWKEKGVSLKGAFWVLLLPLIILVPIYTGIFTVSESAAVAVIYSVVISLIQGTIKIGDLRKVLGESITNTGMVFAIIVGALVLGFLIIKMAAPQQLLAAILAANMPGWTFIVVMMLVLFVLGMFLEGVSITMIVIPLMILPMQTFGFSMIWFAVIFTMAMEMAMITPPVAMNIFIVQRIGQASLTTVMKGLRWYYLVLILALILMALVPILSLWIPNTMFQ